MLKSAMYREYVPLAPLADVVERFWTSSSAMPPVPTASYVLRDGCIDLLFDFVAEDRPRVSIVGAMTRPLRVVTRGAVDLLGVRLRPGGLAAFVKTEARELNDVIADLHMFWGGRAGACDKRERLRTIADALTRCKADTEDIAVRGTVAAIEAARGNIRMRELIHLTGVSARQLERKFASHIGLSPKQFARVVRFKAVAAAAALTPTPDWALLAAEFGFAHQSHLIHEFRQLAGRTPATDVAFLQYEPATRAENESIWNLRA